MALITVMVIAAIITILGATLKMRAGMDTRRTGNIQHRYQAVQFTLGAEAWAWRILREDGTKGEVDDLSEVWAYTLPPITVDQGEVSGYILDMQGRFNLNNLVADGKASGADIERLQRLLRYLKLDPNLVYAIVDWIDNDDDVMYHYGAESVYYTTLPKPYQAANRLMVSTSELRLIKGWDRESADKLLPFVSALPERSAINVNTAAPEVLMTLANDFDYESAQKLARQAQEKGFKTIGEFLAQPLFTPYKAEAGFEDAVKAAYSVKTHYFLVQSHGVFDYGDVVLYTLIHRNDNNIMKKIYRARGYI